MSEGDVYRFYSMDTPVGPIMVAPCMHPESNGERPDIPLDQTCPTHTRTVYYCVDTGDLWCDGLLGEGESDPHTLELTVEGGEELEPLNDEPV